MINVGSKVSWNIDGEYVVGTVLEIFSESVTRIFDGVEFTCPGAAENPAYLIEADDGTHSLRLKSEVRAETDTLRGDDN